MNQLSLGITVALRDAFSSRARRVSRGFSSLDDTAYRAGRGIAHSAGMIQEQIFNITRTLAASAAILGTVAWPTKKAMEFGAAVAEIATIADYANTNMKEVEETLIRQSFRFPTTPIQQAETAYQTISSGFTESTQAALTVVEEATALAVTTRTESDKALRALTGVLNAYSMTADKASHVADKMFETIRYGRIRMDELGKYVGYGASSAAIGGVKMEDMLATAATMTLGSLSPEQVFQYYRQLVIGTMRPTRIAERVGEKFGIDFGKDAIAAVGGNWSEWLLNSYDAIMEKGGDMADFARLLSGRQAFAGAATYINLRKKAQEIREGIDNNTSFDEWGVRVTSRQRALSIQSKELSYQLKRLISGWDGVLTVMGKVSKNVLQPVVSGLASATGWILKLVQAVPMVSSAILGLATASGLATLVFAFQQISKMRGGKDLKKIADAAKVTQIRFGGMTLTLATFVKTLTGTMLILGGVAYMMHKAWDENWGGLNDKVRNFMVLTRSLAHALTNMKGKWGEIPKPLYDQMKQLGLLDTFKTLFKIGYRLRAAMEGFAMGFKTFFIDVAVFAVETLEKWANTLEPHLGFVADKLRAAATWVRELNLDDTAVGTWRSVAYWVGRVAGFAALLLGVTFGAKAGFLAVMAIIKTMFSPFMLAYKAAKLAFWTVPGKAIGKWLALKTVIGETMMGHGAEYKMDEDGNPQLTRHEREGVIPAAKRQSRSLFDTIGLYALYAWDKIKPMFKWMGDKLKALKGPVLKLGSALLWLVKTPLKWVAAAIGAVVTAVGAPFAAGIAIAIGAVALLVWKWDEAKTAAAGMVDYVREKMPNWYSLFSGILKIPSLIGAAKAGLISGLSGLTGLVFEGWKKLLWDIPKALLSGLAAPFVEAWPGVQRGLRVIGDGISNAISDAWTRAKDHTSRFFAWLPQALGINEAFMQGIQNIWTGIGDSISGSWDRIKEHTAQFLDWLPEALGINEEFKQGVSDIWNGIADSISSSWVRIKADTSTALDAIKGWMSSASEWFKGRMLFGLIEEIIGAFGRLAEIASKAWESVRPGSDVAKASAEAAQSAKNVATGQTTNPERTEGDPYSSAMFKRLRLQNAQLFAHGWQTFNEHRGKQRADMGTMDRVFAVRAIQKQLGFIEPWLESNLDAWQENKASLPLFDDMTALADNLNNTMLAIQGRTTGDEDTKTVEELEEEYDRLTGGSSGLEAGIAQGVTQGIDNVFAHPAYMALWKDTIGGMGTDQFSTYASGLENPLTRAVREGSMEGVQLGMRESMGTSPEWLRTEPMVVESDGSYADDLAAGASGNYEEVGGSSNLSEQFESIKGLVGGLVGIVDDLKKTKEKDPAPGHVYLDSRRVGDILYPDLERRAQANGERNTSTVTR